MGEGGDEGEGAGPVSLDDEGDVVAFADGTRVFGDAEGKQFTGMGVADVADAQYFVETDDFASSLIHDNLRVGHGEHGRDPQMVPKIL